MLARVGGGIADWSCTPLPLRPAIESILATTPVVAAIALTASQFWCLPYFAIPYPEQRRSISPTIAALHHSRTTPRSHRHHISTSKPSSPHLHPSKPSSPHLHPPKPSSPHLHRKAIVTTFPPRSHRHHISTPLANPTMSSAFIQSSLTTETRFQSPTSFLEPHECPVPNCNYMVPPKLRRVKENVLYHIRAARKTEKHASLRPHWEFNFARTGYATRIAQADLQCLTPEQRAKRRTDSRNENQRRRWQQCKYEAEVGAAALGDGSLYPRLDKTSEY
jgi:hypothetical protein